VNPVVAGIALGLFLGAVIFLMFVKVALGRRLFFEGFAGLLLSLVCLLSSILVVLVSAGTAGYRALVHEETAATVQVEPLGNQQFRVKIVRPGAIDTAFTLAGDELYMDARILKWKPIVNMLGLHTGYCLDRVAGRYVDIRDERTKVRTVYSLGGAMRPWDLFRLRARYSFLAPILDAQYGSAAFVPVRDARVVKIMVTTSGLIARPE
jgi:hypothetical protein